LPDPDRWRGRVGQRGEEEQVVCRVDAVGGRLAEAQEADQSSLGQQRDDEPDALPLEVPRRWPIEAIDRQRRRRVALQVADQRVVWPDVQAGRSKVKSAHLRAATKRGPQAA
jgi:hypothetical protein